ncbi:helix-turn-helix domain-containing protein [Actinotignum urinale]|uniref:helix-turn-helix domain-containing protein n=2 Tax=Actinotignum urinale TaxID=190146 RepID=UPI000A045389
MQHVCIMAFMSVIEKYTATLTPDQIIGERVHLWLYRHNFTLTDLATWLGLSHTTVSRKVRGTTAWSASDLVKTAAFLNVPLSELLPEETVELEQEKIRNQNVVTDSRLVAGAGFEPTTSGL